MPRGYVFKSTQRALSPFSSSYTYGRARVEALTKGKVCSITNDIEPQACHFEEQSLAEEQLWHIPQIRGMCSQRGAVELMICRAKKPNVRHDSWGKTQVAVVALSLP